MYSGRQIHNAAQHPVELDHAQAAAVEARTELDLRLGAAFTRLQTLALQSRFNQIKDSGEPVSYGIFVCRLSCLNLCRILGPCQFPTLGFVVSRYSQVNAFVPEPFWYIFLSLTRKSDETVFIWRRGHLFEYQVAAVIYEHVLEDATTRVTKVVNKSTKKWCVDSCNGHKVR